MILVDLNVILDVVQTREPYFQYSGKVIDLVLEGKIKAAVPSHFLTTLHYILEKTAGKAEARRVVAWLLGVFEIVPVSKKEIEFAINAGWPDFEDAVSAAAADSSGCECIVTRDVKGYANSRLKAKSPEFYLIEISLFE